MLNEDKKDRFDLESTMRDITDSVVFELLSIFDIDITPEQAPYRHASNLCVFYMKSLTA